MATEVITIPVVLLTFLMLGSVALGYILCQASQYEKEEKEEEKEEMEGWLN